MVWTNYCVTTDSGAPAADIRVTDLPGSSGSFVFLTDGKEQ